jgi:hypothetical protein
MYIYLKGGEGGSRCRCRMRRRMRRMMKIRRIRRRITSWGPVWGATLILESGLPVF